MVNTAKEELVGVECPVCHGEAFQLVARKVSIVAKCCPRCAAAADYEQEDQTTKDAVRAMGKKERLYFLKDKSFEWADKLHGKKVVVFWDNNTHPTLMRHYEKQVNGTAYRTGNECGGWGRVKVVLDPAEHRRITVSCRYTLYCELAGQDMFYAKAPLPLKCWGIKCEHQVKVIDGQRWGLFLNAENGGYYTIVSWGCRKSLVLGEK